MGVEGWVEKNEGKKVNLFCFFYAAYCFTTVDCLAGAIELYQGLEKCELNLSGWILLCMVSSKYIRKN